MKNLARPRTVTAGPSSPHCALGAIMSVDGAPTGAGTRALAVLRDVRPGDKDHPDFRDVEGGGILWKASLVLLHFLERKADLRGKRVLEISAGEGHLACELRHYGTSTRDKRGRRAAHVSHIPGGRPADTTHTHARTHTRTHARTHTRTLARSLARSHAHQEST